MIRSAGVAVVGSILALLLKKNTPELSLMAALATGLAVMWMTVSLCSGIAEAIGRAVALGGSAAVYVSPVLKCVGIGLVSNLAGQVCKDAQQGTAASAIELCGVFCALYVALPLVESVLSVVEKLL